MESLWTRTGIKEKVFDDWINEVGSHAAGTVKDHRVTIRKVMDQEQEKWRHLRSRLLSCIVIRVESCPWKLMVKQDRNVGETASTGWRSGGIEWAGVAGTIRGRSGGVAGCVYRLTVGPWPATVTHTSLVAKVTAADDVVARPTTHHSW